MRSWVTLSPVASISKMASDFVKEIFMYQI
jgi:hypothetical protein